MQVKTAQFRMADRLARGKLAETIQNLQGDGFSYSRISSELYARHGIEVSVQTVSNWLDTLSQPEEVAAS